MSIKPVHASAPPSGEPSPAPGSLRLLVCAWVACGLHVLLCSRCDRGNRYCSRQCARQARLESLRAAGRRYQRGRRGRFRHAARQAKYRSRLTVQKVTHQSIIEQSPLGTLCLTTDPTASSAAPAPVVPGHDKQWDETGSPPRNDSRATPDEAGSSGTKSPAKELIRALLDLASLEQRALSWESPIPLRCNRCHRPLNTVRWRTSARRF